MDYKELAEAILQKTGGTGNISSVQHCVTRLRLVLKDEAAADDAGIKALEGVKGLVKSGGQYQVVIGNGVTKVFDEFQLLVGDSQDTGEAKEEPAQESKGIKGMFNSFFKTITGLFFPVLMLMAASGLIKGLLVLGQISGLLANDSGTYRILYAAADGLFYFFPIILGFSAGKKFNTNPYLCAMIGAALVYPDLQNLVDVTGETDPNLTFLGIPVTLMTYSSSVFPIMIASWCTAKLDRFVKKVIPDAVAFVGDVIDLVIIVPLSYLIIGPVFTVVSKALANGANSFYEFSPILAGLILGAFWQVFVMIGLHYAFIPVFMVMLMTTGSDPLNPILAVSVFSLTGAILGFGLKIKDKKIKSLAFSSVASGILGITEPGLYSIALPYRKPFFVSFIGGGIAGILVAILGGRQFGISTGGILGFGAHIDPSGDPQTLISYFVSAAVAIAVSCIISFIVTGKEDRPVA